LSAALSSDFDAPLLAKFLGALAATNQTALARATETEQLRVWSRYEQIRDDPQKADEAARLAAVLARSGVSILP
jgi:hypothetical protein